ncbi:MAG TPA: leucyl aminopeptidase [Pseudolysinimonas sp.]|jgi:leucyl aminopeptidase|nr:leucyl aminopeptidase [Pseudolysinimonas sp.]
MAAPALSLTRTAPATTDADILVLGVLKGDDGPVLASNDPAFVSLQNALVQIGMSGSSDEVRRLPAPSGDGSPVAVVGLGSAAPDADALRYAAGSAARQLTGIERLAIALPVSSAADAAAILEGAGIGAYAYTGYRVDSLGTTKTPADDIRVHLPADLDADETLLVERARAITQAVHAVRDLVSTPASDLYPETLAAAAADLARDLPIEVEVLDEKELAAGGYGGILGVGSGSARPPRLVTLRYAPDGATRHLSLVGKGITFDTGGLQVKPSSGMINMKYDMTGAVTVLAVTVAAARLGLPVRITARMCIAENMVSGSSMRPNDVLRMRGGTTVEVLNTDAEGRLVMADGLVDASSDQPDAIVDVATLTGAARTALGERYIPVMGDEALARQITEAGASVGETFWYMPMPPELRSMLDSDIADLANGRPAQPIGGMLVAAHFLKHFVGTRGEGADAAPIPWAHLDIAGPANNPGGGWGMTPKGATGVTVRTLIALAEVLSRP